MATTTISGVINDISRTFNITPPKYDFDPAVCGNAIACYDPRDRTIHFAKRPTVGVVAHETGHAMHDFYGIKANTPQYETFASFIEQWYVKSKRTTYNCEGCGRIYPSNSNINHCTNCGNGINSYSSTFKCTRCESPVQNFGGKPHCDACGLNYTKSNYGPLKQGTRGFSRGKLLAITLGITTASTILGLVLADKLPPKTKTEGIDITRTFVASGFVGLLAGLLLPIEDSSGGTA